MPYWVRQSGSVYLAKYDIQTVTMGDDIKEKNMSQDNFLVHPLCISPLSRILVIGALHSISLHSPCGKLTLAGFKVSIELLSHSPSAARQAEKIRGKSS